MPIRTRWPDLARIGEAVEGKIPMRMELLIRFAYGSIIPGSARAGTTSSPRPCWTRYPPLGRCPPDLMVRTGITRYRLTSTMMGSFLSLMRITNVLEVLFVALRPKCGVLGGV